MVFISHPKRLLIGVGLFTAALYAGCNVYDPSLLPGIGATGGSSGNTEAGSDSVAGSESASGNGGKPSGGSGGGGAPTDVAGSGNGGMPAGGSGGKSPIGDGGVPNAAGQPDGDAGDGGAPPAPNPTELAQGKSALASSTQTNNDAFKGNDGDVVSRWCAVNGNFPQWWRVDLGETHVLASFSVRFEYPQRAHSYLIETSSDDVTYAAVPGTTATDVVGDVQSGVFPQGSSARYVRISVTNAAPPTDPNETPRVTWASFFEFSVLGF